MKEIDLRDVPWPDALPCKMPFFLLAKCSVSVSFKIQNLQKIKVIIQSECIKKEIYKKEIEITILILVA